MTTGGTPLTNPTWEGNILFNATPGIIPSSGFTMVNPQLSADASGVFHISSTSPAINASVGSFPYVIDDMDGQLRSSTPDVGADEFSTAPVTRHALTPADVGPNASEADFSLSANPASQTVTTGGSTSYTVTATAAKSRVITSAFFILCSPRTAIHTDSAIRLRLSCFCRASRWNGSPFCWAIKV